MSCRFCHCEDYVFDNSDESMDDEEEMISSSKVFEYFPMLPPELKMMVVDEMAPRDRCVFSECSRLSLKQAKASKNYIYSLELFVHKDSVSIEIVHNEYYYSYDKEDGFILNFEKESNSSQKIMRCRTLEYRELWKTELDESIDLVQFGTIHFKNLLQFYQNKIKMLYIGGADDKLKNFDFGIETLKNLEILTTSCEVDITQFLSKIKHPLKILSTHHRSRNQYLADFDQIYQVQDYLSLRTKLNREQFLRISAKKVNMDIGELTEQDIFNFVKSWQNGKYTGRIKNCEWYIENSKFDRDVFCQILEQNGIRMQKNGKYYRLFEIEQNGTCKIVELKVYVLLMTFKVIDECESDLDSESENEDSDSDFDW